MSYAVDLNGTWSAPVKVVDSDVDTNFGELVDIIRYVLLYFFYSLFQAMLLLQ